MTAKLYVANSGEGTISVIDCEQLKEIGRITLPAGIKAPRRLLLTGQGLFCAEESASAVGRFCGLKREGFEMVSVGTCPTGLCAAGEGILVSCGESNSIWKLKSAPLCPLWCVQTGAFPVGVAVAEEYFAAAELFTGRVIFRKEEEQEPCLQFQKDGMPLCIASDGKNCLVGYLLANGEGKIWRFSAREAPFAAAEGIRPVGQIFCLKGQNKAVAAHVWNDSFSLIDYRKGIVLWTKKAGRMPDDICADGGGRIFISCIKEDAVRVFDEEGNPLKCIAVGKAPRGLALEQLSL